MRPTPLLAELQLIVQHLIERNYRDEIDASQPFQQQCWS